MSASKQQAPSSSAAAPTTSAAASSTAAAAASSGSSPPMLAMLVDRTSFDETDSFRVDKDALVSTAWSSDQSENGPLAGSAGGAGNNSGVIMRNGKVRRRLRWRPKGRTKPKKGLPPPAESSSSNRPPTSPFSNSTSVASSKAFRPPMSPSPLRQVSSITGNSSSNGSVTGSVTGNSITGSSVVSSSTMSHSSKGSKKSQHSFASVETQVKSNTTRTKAALRFPLPRPNYPSKLDGTAPPPPPPPSTPSTTTTTTSITETGVEATAADSQIVYSSPDVFTATPNAAGGEEKKEDEDTTSTDGANSHGGSSAGSSSRKSGGGGFKPLFKKKHNHSSSRSLSARSTTPTSIPESARGDSPVTTVSAPPAPITPPETSSSSSSPLPRLSGEDVEQARRVDLRIRKAGEKPAHLMLGASSNIQARAAAVAGAPVTIEELRTSDPPPWTDLLVMAAATANQGKNRPPLAPGSKHPIHVLPTDSNELARLTLKGSGSASLQPSRTAQQQQQGAALDPTSEAVRQVLGAWSTTEKNGLPDFAADFLLDEEDDSSAHSDGFHHKSRGGPGLDNNQELRFSLSNKASLANSPTFSSAHTAATQSTSGSSSAGSSGRDRAPPPATSLVTPRAPSANHHPVDLDNGQFLEAEKNLQAIHDMASEHLQQGEYDEALEVFEEILRGQLARYGHDHYRVGTAFHNIGIVHMRRGDYEQATSAYREAVKVRKRALAPDHSDVAVSQAQLGVAYLERRLHKKAISAFRDALRIRRRSLGPNHPKVAKILNNIGCALYELNELDVAQVAFEEALDIQRQVLRDEPIECQDISNHGLLSIASTLSNIGSIKLYTGMYDEASVDLEEALLIQQCVFGDDHPVPRQTQESLKWIEQTRSSSSGNISSSLPLASAFDLFSHFAGSISSATTGPKQRPGPVEASPSSSSTNGLIISCDPVTAAVTRRHRSKSHDSPLMSASEVLDSVEERFVTLQARLENACGGEDSSDGDNEEEEVRRRQQQQQQQENTSLASSRVGRSRRSATRSNSGRVAV